MGLRTLAEVVALLCSRVLRVRTGLWLIPNAYIGHEADEAVRLRLEVADLRQVWLKNLPEGTRFIGLTPDNLIEEIDRIIQQPGDSDCVLVYNLDLFLARLKLAERKMVWESLFNTLPHRPRGLLMIMPQTAHDLLPVPTQLTLLEQEQRLVGTDSVV